MARPARLLPMPAATPAPAPVQASGTATPLAHTKAEVAQLIRCSERHVQRLIRSGKLRAKRSGGRVLILDADLRRYLEELPPA